MSTMNLHVAIGSRYEVVSHAGLTVRVGRGIDTRKAYLEKISGSSRIRVNSSNGLYVEHEGAFDPFVQDETYMKDGMGFVKAMDRVASRYKVEYEIIDGIAPLLKAAAARLEAQIREDAAALPSIPVAETRNCWQPCPWGVDRIYRGQSGWFRVV